MSKFSKKKKYSQDGVDVEEESLFSSFAGSVCKASYKNSGTSSFRKRTLGLVV